MYLLDTNVLAELRILPHGRGNPRVRAWLAAQPPLLLFLSAITLFETEIGIRRLERRDPRQGKTLRAWMTEAVLTGFGGRVLPVDTDIVLLAAGFHVPNPAPFADSLIAATAVRHRLTVVTRNTRDFRFPGVPLVNPWEG